MIIEKIEIESFGKFKDFTLAFENGVNVLYGENEAGKSTICAFLQAMFYDLPSSKQKYTLREDLRKRYMPWHGGDMSGAVYFSHDDKRYILKRRMGKTPRSTKVSLYDAETWEEIKDERKDNPGEYFFGVGEDGFLKTIYISQLGAVIERGKNDEIIERLSNLRQSGDEDISYQKTVDILTKQKHSLISVGGGAGKIIKLKEESEKLKSRISVALENEAIYKNAIVKKTEEESKKEELIKEKEDLLSKKELAQKHQKYEEALIVAENLKKVGEEKQALLSKLNKSNEKLKETEERKKELDFLEGAGEDAVKMLSDAERETAVLKEKLSKTEERKKEVCRLEKEMNELLEASKKKSGLRYLKPICLALAAGIFIAGGVLSFAVNFMFSILCIVAVLIAVFAVISSMPSANDKENERKLLELSEKIKITTPDLNEENEILKAIDKARELTDEIFSRFNVHSQAELIKKLSERETINELLKAAQNENAIINENIKRIEDEEKRLMISGDLSNFSDDEKAYSGMVFSEIEEKLSLIHNELIMCEKKLSEAETTLNSISKDDKSSAELMTEAEIINNEIEELQKLYDATDKALCMIEESYEVLKSDFAPLLSEKVKTAALSLTSGKYTDIRLSDDYTLKVESAGEITDADYLSGGTYDVLYLALRLGILKILFGDKLPLLILDDTFLQLDDERAICAASYLKSELSGQLLYFTCHKNQSELFGTENVNIIKL